MVFEILGHEKELFKQIIYEHANSDFFPASDFNLELYGYGVLDSKGKKHKLILSDLDGVWTKTPLFIGYIEALSNINPGIANSTDEIIRNLSKLDAGNSDEVVKHISEIFRTSGVKKWQHEKATKRGVERSESIPNAFKTVSDSIEMGYEFHFISGSPDSSVKGFVETKLGIDSTHAIGSEYIFKEDSFERIEDLLYGKKRGVCTKLLESFMGSEKGFVIFLSDELEDFRTSGHISNTFILVNEKQGESDKAIIELPSITRGAEILPYLLRKIERGMCLYFGFDSIKRNDILGSALNVGNLCTDIRTTKYSKLTELKDELLSHYSNYKALSPQIFPFYLSNIDNLIYRLKIESDPSEIRTLSEKFWKEFTKYSPDYNVAKKIYSNHN